MCLSILGTWRGEAGEEWSSAQGLESILWSIQSLMCSNPYENEPDFEDHPLDDPNNPRPRLYAAKIRHESLRISVLKRLEDHFAQQDAAQDSSVQPEFGADEAQLEPLWEPFIELFKIRFGWHFQSYLDGIVEARNLHGDDVKDGKKFPTTEFEFGGNAMHGEYAYSRLEKSLERMRLRLDEEAEQISREGKQLELRESPHALLFQNQFNALKRMFSRSDTPLDLEMIDNNPFDWRLIIFGRPMTNLEGGIFKIRLVMPYNFPDRQPRVKVETPLFHHRISNYGVLCYIPKVAGEIKSHIEAIIHAIEDENPTYDPRTIVNPTAAKLLWGTPEQKKAYSRRLRQSAQATSE